MAGDWIKMRTDLGTDPAVVAIAEALEITEDEVVGKLHRIWSWADKHCSDGRAPLITPKWVDRYLGISGFAAAMVTAGWLGFDDAGIEFPNFDRHNGSSAKSRAGNTQRRRSSRNGQAEKGRGRKRSSTPRPFIRFVMERDGYQCVYCGEERDPEEEAAFDRTLAADHIVPESRGGGANVENLACACVECNLEKGARTPEEWGVLPTFLQRGVKYSPETGMTVSRKSRDKSATREEKRIEDLKPGSGKQAARQTGRTAPAEPGGESARTSSSGAPALKTPEKPAGSQRTSRSNAQPAASAGTGRVLSTGNGSGQPRGQPTGREPGQADKRAADGAKPPPACTSRDGTGGIWKRVSEELLRDDRALLEWTRDATERAIVESCDATALRIFGVAERALEVGTKPAALFVSLVKAGDWTKTSNEQEERGRRRLAALRAKSTGPPAGSLAVEYLQDAGRLPAYANVKHPR